MVNNTQADVTFWAMQLGNTMLILYKDDFEFVSKFPCLLGHSVSRV